MRLSPRIRLQETIDNTRRTITDPNTDARAAMQVIKELSSPSARKKLVAAFGEERATKLLAEVDKATAALELRAVLATNSRTAARLQGVEAIRDETAPGILGQMARGEVPGSVRSAVRVLTGARDNINVDRHERIMRELATALTQSRGPDARRGLEIINKALTGQPVKDADAEFLARVAVTPLLLSFHQSLLQRREMR